MTGVDHLHPGQVFHLGPACGIQWRIRPIYFRLIKADGRSSWDGAAWLDGYEVDQHLVAVDRRTAYVIVAGLVPLGTGPSTQQRQTRRPDNRGPIPVPKQRTGGAGATARSTR